ncbi:Armadillo-like helical [Cordyceps fumosorosea ARSEF 2679]|uniref:Armadillo-like helical n=1 Tax=Cordyceps fumosorosea (strain ARSEF 2679) TaxID=1081104 RepID=A0A166YGT7_CORFA|nr:Armadillo-like helical [Cordyceps fumosorosea ARSEF 2679]OAA36889.1 Armadillo-like helical [Cordyceps fumosorosea ARSEF 2679]
MEEEPLEFLGPTHQRLVMHCLSELTRELPTRGALEQLLGQWLLFECKFNNRAKLASEPEFPEKALENALLDKSKGVQRRILDLLASRASVPPRIGKLVAARLGNEDSAVRTAAVQALGERAALPDEVLTAVVARFGDEDWDVRDAAVGIFLGRHKQSYLHEASRNNMDSIKMQQAEVREWINAARPPDYPSLSGQSSSNN